MYKVIITDNAQDYLKGDCTANGISFAAVDIEEVLATVNAFVKRQFAVIVEEVTN